MLFARQKNTRDPMLEKIVPVVTPFDGNRINTVLLRNHFEQLLSDGVDLILLCGTGGLVPH
jgi:dihydrodipicolinate synthase/N-acetylneuraminate lyase